MGCSRKNEILGILVALVLVLLQVLVGNGQPQCNFTQPPPCPQNVSGLGHVILVHGGGQGEWYWYKVKPILEAAGYNVTTIQLGPSVTAEVNSIENVTFFNYSQPLYHLMDCIDHTVFIVSHSFGGLSMACAMDKHPDKVQAAVFVAAYMPDTSHNMYYVIQQQSQNYTPHWDDTCITTSGNNNTWYFFGDNFLDERLYQMCSPEDIALMHTQKRPASFFESDLSAIQLSKDKYGSVDRYYIKTGADYTIATKYQEEMISNFPVKESTLIRRSGHEVMVSKPLELSAHLLDIFRRYRLLDQMQQFGSPKIRAKRYPI